MIRNPEHEIARLLRDQSPVNAAIAQTNSRAPTASTRSTRCLPARQARFAVRAGAGAQD
jgi:hypothetical protein